MGPQNRTVSALEPSSLPQRPVRSVWVCLLPSPHQAAPPPPHPFPPSEQASSPCLSQPPFSEPVEARLIAADPKTLAVALLCGAIMTWASPRIWRTADLKIVHVHTIGMEELRAGEWLALRPTINIHDSPTSSPEKKKKSAVFTYHLAVVQGSLGFVGALGAAAPAFPLPALQLGLADLKDRGAGGPAGALFAPIRCRTHAYTSTKPKPLVQCAPARAARWLPCAPPPSSRSEDPRRGTHRVGAGCTGG